MKFFTRDFLGKCDETAVFANLVTFTGEILNGELLFSCIDLILE